MFNLSGLSDDVRDAYTQHTWHDKKPDQLLGVSNDAKTIKGEKLGISTAILYLAPHNISGVNVCPVAKLALCDEPCLNTAGRGAMHTVQASRLRKTLYLTQYTEEFKEQIKREILAHVLLAIKKNMVPAIRLNGTSDIRWELYLWDFMCEMRDKYGAIFYDYTKIPNRKISRPEVYDITFSYSGVEAYQRMYWKARRQGNRVAVVFRDRNNIPDTWDGLPVVSGDNSDARWLDPQGCVVALYAKGRAKHDATGFVVD